MAKHSAERPKKKASTALLAIGVACALVAVCAISFILVSQWQLQQAKDRLQQTGTPQVVTNANTGNAQQLPNNPVDFASLKKQNPDIYSWIYVPNTNINYPILQSVVDDNFYLEHDVDGNPALEGALFTQSCNSTDYQDSVTLVYGHNIDNPVMMFHQLHLFEDQKFFTENTTFFIYTPGHIFTYEIVAAYEYDNRHIMNSFNFSNPEVVESYFNSVLTPNSLVANVREGATLQTSDKIVQLSTCVTSRDSNSRYIVTGKLINDQPTR